VKTVSIGAYCHRLAAELPTAASCCCSSYSTSVPYKTAFEAKETVLENFASPLGHFYYLIY